jgi:hypothetical protein
MELALRLLLAGVFAWAGTAKIVALPRAASALADFGITERRRRPVVASLAVAEVAVAVALASDIASRPAAIVAGVLSAIFLLALIRQRLAGRTRSRCGCFGGKRPANTVLLAARAAVIGSLAIAVATGLPDVAMPAADVVLTAAILGLSIIVVALAIAVLALYRQVGVLSLRLQPQTALELEDEGPPLGHPAPLLEGLTRRGTELVAFVSPNCRMCVELVPGLRALAREGLPVHWVREDEDDDAFDRWRTPGTPYVVQLVDGTVYAKGLVNTLEQIDWVLDMGEERHRHAA